MTSAEIRQSFFDFFAQRGHTIVPSAPLLPSSPGLLFTNAGMNQFVPIFLGEAEPRVSQWAGARPARDTRAADTQKCIRAGGKHNDLEDVGFDTYHHTFFEMLGNWSFGDYFKADSLRWGWELLTQVWGIPAKRLFATIYAPDKAQGDPADFDQEAYDIWAEIFKNAGLDPALHIVHGGKKDNFWMMGETGPCGPCSELHFNLLPDDDEAAGRALVNRDSPRCIEIWNHVFIQFNANADGSFAPLAAKHVDTGMGFERVAGLYATTRGFTDFTAEPSNYAADLFAPLFAEIAARSGKHYAGTVPARRDHLSEQEQIDVAFRVLADHARCLTCAIADGIMPGNEGRNYVIRRILRRGILYGAKLGLKTGFFEKLVAPVVASLGPVFKEVAEQEKIICRIIRSEEESFGRTLERGLTLFNRAAGNAEAQAAPHAESAHAKKLSGEAAFELYDTYGFPLDMTQLLATERGLSVDTQKFEALMEQQRERARAAQKKEIVVAATEGSETGTANAAALTPTRFVGYTQLDASATLVELIRSEGAKKADTTAATYLVFDQSPFYAEMGGQVGDTGKVTIGKETLRITDTVKDGNDRHLHRIHTDDTAAADALTVGNSATLSVDAEARAAITRHHTAAHLVHWALRQVLGPHVRQAGSSNTTQRLRFDFSHFEAMRPEELREVERLVNARILENAEVQAYETEFDKKPADTLAFFGDKYGHIVRVVDTGGFSRELCGGTHVTRTGEIGLIKLVGESAIAAGTRRIEAVAGQAAYDLVATEEAALRALCARLGASPSDALARLDALLDTQKELERKLKSFSQKAAAGLADELTAKAQPLDAANAAAEPTAALKRVIAVVEVESPEALRTLGSQVLAKLGEGVVQLGAAFGEKATVVAFCSPAAIAAGYQAGKLVAALSAQIGGKGGGKPDFAMGGGAVSDRWHSWRASL
ncbi:alanine--tRNA ligase [Cephaloticoccus capnophilus]|uniref:Alanine--tRNA ligase n=1 Tax=Cephaloticoccus capnophilus TaxID=1548208 RepID=A0A139SK13_9BACT|nr:alanine--tRNA ligase [Cephaloticoccus capnophilus]KXU34891.1 alanine--tRNA ligase [Cephaloticoccus capnophilus]